MARSQMYTLGVSAFAGIGTFLYVRFDTGIATTREAVDALLQTFFGDKLGRVRVMQLMCLIITVETTIQTASVNFGMFLAGRVLAGIAVGGMISMVRLYLSEVAAPHNRGLAGSISGCVVSSGTMMSKWVGLACTYAPYGPAQWRLPLGIQVPWNVILFIGLSTFIPDSSRHLVQHGKIEQALVRFKKTRRDLTDEETDEEFQAMRARIEFEMHREIKSLKEVFVKFRHRALV
ncbi:hypothetical protein H9L39_18680 [Fusarium oxysporum f. sp. albedinis]|nr:hypothetical protein H9L39_18680 [Fusarium oxysporum f. sp. albedinis]